MRYQIPNNDDDFELLCMKLLRKKWNRPQLEQYGKRGQRQDGIDLLDLGGSDPLYAAQCKLREPHKSLSASEIEDEVRKAEGFRLKLGVYAILTTAKDSTEADRKIVEINRKHAAEGLFTVELLTWKRIQDLLDEYSDVRDEFFGGIDSSQVARLEQRLANIPTTISAIGSERAADAYHAEIDEAKAALERYEPQLARLLLQRLQKKHWDELSARQRFRLLSNLGSASLQEGETEKAAQFFFQARTFQPEDERALANEVLGYYILGDLQKSLTLSSELREKFPFSAPLAALWINSSPGSLAHLEASISPVLFSEAQVAVPLAVRALQELNFARAKELLQAIRKGKTEWSAVPGLMGRALVGEELHERVEQKVRSTQEVVARLKEAEGLFTHALELARNEKQTLAVSQILLDRANVRTLLGDEQGPALDIEEAYRISPDDASVAAMMAGLRRSKGDLDRAINTLRRTAQASERPDVRFHLASALHGRGRNEDLREAADLFCNLASDKQIAKAVRTAIVGLAIDCFVKEGRFDEAERFVTGLADQLSSLSTYAFRGRVDLARGDQRSAISNADAALSLVGDESDGGEIQYLAKLLNQLGRYKDALPLWQKVTNPGTIGVDARPLLETASRLQRHDVILEVCQRFRNAGAYNREFLKYEIDVLREYDSNAAIALLKEHLSTHPEDDVARLDLSLIGLAVGDADLVCADPLRVPEVGKVTPEGGHAIVNVLKLGGRPNDALVYAYELLRLNFSAPAAHRAFQLALLPLGPMPDVIDYDAAGPGTAVTYVEDGDGTPHTIVIEEPPQQGPAFHDQRSPADPLAKRLTGKRVGDSFVLATGTLSTRTARIIKILNKYVYRYQDSTGEWQVRFPEDSTLESVQVIKEPGADPDFSPILNSIDQQQKVVETAEGIYREKPVSVHMLGAQFGKNSFESTNVIANRDGLVLKCCDGTEAERAQALSSLRACSEVVIELTAISTLSMLRLVESLRHLTVPVIVSHGTSRELTDALTQKELAGGPSGIFTKVDGKYALIEETAEERRQHVTALKNLVSLLKSTCKITPCIELAAMPPETRDILYKAFGQHGAESILLARSPGRLLWTDDYVLAGFAAHEHGVRRVWTQPVLEHLVQLGKITPDTYFDASAKLLGFQYSFTSSNPEILMSAGRLAGWQSGAWPLRQALDQFNMPTIDAMPLLRMAILFSVQLYQEGIDPDVPDRVFTRVLDNLFLKLQSRAPIEALQRVLPRLFGMNAVGLEQVSECIRRWLSSSTIIVPT